MQEYIEPQMVRIIHPKPKKTMQIEMVHLPSGRFMMGEEGSQKEVIIDYEFEIGKYPVIFDEYDLYCDDMNIDKPDDKGWGRGERPVINVSWEDANRFCKWLSEKSGDNYRLPTEIEWEYACRAGGTTKWSFGNDKRDLSKYAWYYKNGNGSTHLVKGKKPNKWNLYDMHGNVWEWCEDSIIVGDLQVKKVLRGGSWANTDYNTYSSYRYFEKKSNKDYRIGFRILRTLP